MGCGSSNQFAVVNYAPGITIRHLLHIDDLTLTDIESAWVLANKLSASNNKVSPVVKRTGWKTIRIFVSSTFKDFDSEREILVKKIFPDLRVWCQSRRLHLIECDLRWGVPSDANTETTLRSCLGEIDRCYSENIMPFFVNMTSERVGWIPLGDEIPEAIKSEYEWIEGLSVTEMEIMHGAYRTDNPNALFMLRDASFLDHVPADQQEFFVDENKDIAPYKLQLLKQMIGQKFGQTSRLEYYGCSFNGINSFGKPSLKLDPKFAESVIQFFKDRISAQYPIIEAKHLDKFEEAKLQNEAFMKMTAERVVGRDMLIDDLVKSYILPENPPPVVIVGGHGLGKTSIMAALVDRCLNMARSNRLPKNGKFHGWRVFYHFVGSVPGSTDLLAMLQRMLLEMKVVTKHSKLPISVEETMAIVRSATAKSSTRNTILIVDALNQLDESHGIPSPVSWLPTQLSPNIRLIVSATPSSKQFKLIHDLASDWMLEQIKPMDRKIKQELVSFQLGRWNKQLDSGQMDLLLNKQSSGNPLWLSLACEELRVFGQFRELTNKIRKLKDGLLELEEEILARFELENEGWLLVATLCYMEVSVRGLLESELLEILASTEELPEELTKLLESKRNEEILAERSEKPEKRPKKTMMAKPKGRKAVRIAPALTTQEPTPLPTFSDVGEQMGRITAKRWADLYRVLRPFIRPFGSSGEGRLDFYHRSLSKAIRRRYFSVVKRTSMGESAIKCDGISIWFHGVLASYFNSRCLDLERRIEEYPMHAYQTKDLDGLITFLSDWEVFDAMYDSEFSKQLSQSWTYVYDLSSSNTGKKPFKRIAASNEGASVGSEVYSKMEEIYLNALTSFSNDSIDPSIDEGMAKIDRIERVCRVLMQNGRYSAAVKLADRLIGVSLPPSSDNHVKENGEKPEQNGTAEPVEMPPPGVTVEAMLWHAGFIYLKAQVYDEEMRSQDYMYTAHLPKLMTLVECFEKAITIFDKLAPSDERLGKSLNRVGFHYSGIAMRNGTEKLGKEQAKKMAVKRVEDAIDFYSRLDDQPVNLADCYISRGVCEGTATQSQIDYYMKGLNLAIEHVGLFHPILDRAYLNVGIYYEDSRNTAEAYNYFRKWYQLLVAVYGQSHPRTLRAIRILNETTYQRMAAAKGHTVPSPGLHIITDHAEEEVDEFSTLTLGLAPALPIE